VVARARRAGKRRAAAVDSETRRRIGKHLRGLREDRRMTQASVAEPSFTAAFISMVESGRALPSMKSLLHMARRLKVSLRQTLPPDL
jgi:transcriptional regulator with XRE-family HTH domain